jgi:hypothetical protein
MVDGDHITRRRKTCASGADLTIVSVEDSQILQESPLSEEIGIHLAPPRRAPWLNDFIERTIGAMSSGYWLRGLWNAGAEIAAMRRYCVDQILVSCLVAHRGVFGRPSSKPEEVRMSQIKWEDLKC